MCGEHVAMAAVLPYVWSDACRDRVFPSLLPFFHAHGAHREKFARPDSSTAVSPHTELQQTQFAGLYRCFTYNYLKLFKTIFCGLKNG